MLDECEESELRVRVRPKRLALHLLLEIVKVRV